MTLGNNKTQLNRIFGGTFPGDGDWPQAEGAPPPPMMREAQTTLGDEDDIDMHIGGTTYTAEHTSVQDLAAIPPCEDGELEDTGSHGGAGSVSDALSPLGGARVDSANQKKTVPSI